MKLKDLTFCWIYSPVVIDNDGEKIKKWKFKCQKKLNIQQDISELDRNSAGIIDYNKLKIRTKTNENISKYDGISLNKLEIGDDNYTLSPPEYQVIASPKVGRTTTYTCEIYHGE